MSSIGDTSHPTRFEILQRDISNMRTDIAVMRVLAEASSANLADLERRVTILEKFKATMIGAVIAASVGGGGVSAAVQLLLT